MTSTQNNEVLTSPNRRGQRRGFALIATLMLMILLSILALGMLSLSSVSLRNSSSALAMSEARANARMALVLAIGELQKSAGPDQRVTATADMAASADGSALATGQDPENDLSLDGTEKGLTRVLPGTRYWTGVFVNRDDPDSVYKKIPAARIIRWLVSGAEAAVSGQPPILTPANQDCLVNADGIAANPAKAAVLVGANTVGTGAASREQYVAAPLVSVDTTGGSGLAGKFAYWVGDEGVKARINMERTAEDPTGYASLVAQRRGWETVPGFTGYPTPAADADAKLPSVATLRTIECMLPATLAGNPSPRQSVFHSATTDSRGLLVDTLGGGTRVDLTSAFSNDLASPKPADGYDNYPEIGARVIPPAAVPGLQHLKWDHVLRFSKLHEGLSGGALRVRSRTAADTDAIAPTIIDFRMLMGARLKGTDESNPNSTTYKVNPCAKIALTIANPYSVPLVWNSSLEFEIKGQTQSSNPTRVWLTQNTCAIIPRNASEPAVFNQTVFSISPGRLEPGEARAYTQPSQVLRPKSAATGRSVVEMAVFGEADPFDFNRCVEAILETPVTLPFELRILESGTTSLVGLEMRLGGSPGGQWLRRIDGFELDNGISAIRRRFNTPAQTNQMVEAIPLMLYSFQISQPGMDYQSLMPAGYHMGQRASTLRTFADFNLRAANLPRPIASYNPTPYFMERKFPPSNRTHRLIPL